MVRHPAPAGASDSAGGLAADGGTAAAAASATPQCPHLEEFERCDASVIDCRTYTWRWTSWTVCLLPDSVPGAATNAQPPAGMAATPCGSGRRFRYAECVRSDGQVVAEQFCRQHLHVVVFLYFYTAR